MIFTKVVRNFLEMVNWYKSRNNASFSIIFYLEITNKILIKAVGINAAILIGELFSEYNYWEQKNELKYGEWFYSTRENIEEQTGLSEDQQRRAINKLIKMLNFVFL